MQLEMQIEKGEATQETVQQVITLYTQAAAHYDATNERQLGEIYRQKIQMIFMKPHVLAIYT